MVGLRSSAIALVGLGVCAAAAGCSDCGSSAPHASRDPGVRLESSAPPAAATSPAPLEPLDAAVRATLGKFECNRCHDGLGATGAGGARAVADVDDAVLTAAPRDKHCVRCHQQIQAGTFDADADALADWQANIKSLLAAPSLTAIGARLRRGWVRDHLLEPRDVRPALPATMPRLAISEAEAERVARFLVPDEAPARDWSGADRARGAALYRELGCAACHAFGGVAPRLADGRYATAPGGPPTPPAPQAIWLAPDLSEARTRVQRGRLAAWIADAPAIKPDTLMPDYAIGDADAQALAAYILFTPVAPAAPNSPPAPLPLLEREVGYNEVAARVFRKICWHCHASPDYARGDGGPGMSGGFGFPGRGLDLSTYGSMAAGSIGPDGARRSVFAALDDGTPRLVAHPLARHAEQAGQPIPGVRGMPLGLPALPLPDIQLVASWIAQGRPR